jgi:hypothetical protein
MGGIIEMININVEKIQKMLRVITKKERKFDFENIDDLKMLCLKLNQFHAVKYSNLHPLPKVDNDNKFNQEKFNK